MYNSAKVTKDASKVSARELAQAQQENSKNWNITAGIKRDKGLRSKGYVAGANNIRLPVLLV